MMPFPLLYLSIGILLVQQVIGSSHAVRNQCGGVLISRRQIEFYVCPTKEHASYETQCCDTPEFNCCRQPTFYETNKFAIASAVIIITLIVLTSIIILCLRWEVCILHRMVRREPKLDYIASPAEMENLNRFSEESTEVRSYQVNPEIRYQRKDDDD